MPQQAYAAMSVSYLGQSIERTQIYAKPDSPAPGVGKHLFVVHQHLNGLNTLLAEALPSSHPDEEMSISRRNMLFDSIIALDLRPAGWNGRGMTNIPENTTSRAGRPRSMTLEALLEAIRGIDIHRMTMKEVAAHLGIGTATLYRYVQDRDELVRLAVGQSSHRSPPPDINQPWQDLVEGYAYSIYSAFDQSPDLIRAYIDGALGPELEVEFLDGFLAAMDRRGFDPVSALDIFSALGMIGIGAAVTTAHATAERARRGNFSDAVRTVLDARPPGDLATLRSAVTIYGDLDLRTDWRTGISHLIRSIAASRD